MQQQKVRHETLASAMAGSGEAIVLTVALQQGTRRQRKIPAVGCAPRGRFY